MKPKRTGWLALWALLAACSKCPDGDMAGNSAGCGNPIKTAQLVPLAQNPCNDCSGAWPHTPYRVAFGEESLSIRLSLQRENPEHPGLHPDSIVGWLYLFEAGQVPVFEPSPVDSLSLRDSVFVITPADLKKMRRRGGGDSSYTAFSALVHLTYFHSGVAFPQASLLMGLVYDWNFGSFSYSDRNPLAVQDSSQTVRTPVGGYYQGTLVLPDSIAADSGTKYVYVPGSPFFTMVDNKDRTFNLRPLPLGESYELRFFAMPITSKHGDAVPAYRLESAPASGSERAFGLRDLKETVILP